MSLRITPSASHASTTSNTSASKFSSSATSQLSKGAPSAPGLPDTLRLTTQNASPAVSSTVTSSHPLESRLANWTATQESLKHQMLRRTFGLGEPVRRGMELKMVRDADYLRPAVLGRPGGVHEDILMGRETEITWEDVYTGEEARILREGADGEGRGGAVLDDIERGVRMDKW